MSHIFIQKKIYLFLIWFCHLKENHFVLNEKDIEYMSENKYAEIFIRKEKIVHKETLNSLIRWTIQRLIKHYKF